MLQILFKKIMKNCHILYLIIIIIIVSFNGKMFS